MATVITSIGAGTTHNANNTISAVLGAGPWTVTVADGSLCVVGDALMDEHATPRKYLITGISSNDLTVRDSEGVGGAPDNSGTSQAVTTRYYNGSTPITTWEADLDDTGLYAAADMARGECYNDAAFDESVIINGGGTVGLASITLTVPEGERLDGTAGTGARIVRTANGEVIRLARTNLTVEWIEVDANGQSNTVSGTGAFTVASNESATPTTTVRNVIGHDYVNIHAACYAIGNVSNGRSIRVLNSIFYNIHTSKDTGAAGFGIRSMDNLDQIYNITVHNITRTQLATKGPLYGIYMAASATCTSCIATDVSADDETGVSVLDFGGTGTWTYNLSSDESSDDQGGAGNLINKSSANQFVSTTGGSEDLHLKAGADAIDAGTDLGTTPTGVNYDIDNRDRDAEGDTWDIGADEYVAVGGAGHPTMRRWGGVPYMIPGLVLAGRGW